MNDFTNPHHRFSLGNFQLRLDPEIQREIQALQSAPPTPRLRNLFLRPNWRLFRQDELTRMLAEPPTPSPAPFVPRGRGPSTPRAAEVGDLMSAIWAIPAVQQASNQLLNRLAQQARQGWRGMSGGERALVISWAGLISGSALAAALQNRESRQQLLNFVAGRNIPVPGLDGLSFKLRERGAGAAWSDIGGSGVTVRGGGGVSESGRAQYDFAVSIDVMPYLP